MNTYSDNQTGHLYVVENTSDVVLSNTVNHMFNIQFKHNNKVDETSDILDDRRILNVKVKAVEPIYFRKWTVNALNTGNAPVVDTLYSLYFYLENMQGFGMQDRWDIAATYKVKNGDDDAAIMAHLAMELYAKINVNGPIKNDFIISYGGKDITEKDYEVYANKGTLPTATSGNNIIVRENDTPNYPTYTHSDMEIRTNAHPYEYDLTLSTYDGTDLWGNNPRRIRPDKTNPSTDTVRFKSGVIVKDMEQFFMRNRMDLYSLNPNFNTSIVNDLKADRTAAYSIVNIHYAFSDGLGFTYYSEKDLNIAVKEAAENSTTNGTTVKNAILNKIPINNLEARVEALKQ